MNFVVTFIDVFFNLLIVAIFIRVLLSWFRIDPDNSLIKIINQLTDPILLPFQKIIPPLGMIDFSPIVALIALEILKELLIFGIKLIF